MTIRWWISDSGRFTTDRERFLDALESAYAAGYRDARADAAKAIGEMIPEHELTLTEEGFD